MELHESRLERPRRALAGNLLNELLASGLEEEEEALLQAFDKSNSDSSFTVSSDEETIDEVESDFSDEELEGTLDGELVETEATLRREERLDKMKKRQKEIQQTFFRAPGGHRKKQAKKKTTAARGDEDRDGEEEDEEGGSEASGSDTSQSRRPPTAETNDSLAAPIRYRPPPTIPLEERLAAALSRAKRVTAAADLQRAATLASDSALPLPSPKVGRSTKGVRRRNAVEHESDASLSPDVQRWLRRVRQWEGRRGAKKRKREDGSIICPEDEEQENMREVDELASNLVPRTGTDSTALFSASNSPVFRFFLFADTIKKAWRDACSSTRAALPYFVPKMRLHDFYGPKRKRKKARQKRRKTKEANSGQGRTPSQPTVAAAAAGEGTTKEAYDSSSSDEESDCSDESTNDRVSLSPSFAPLLVFQREDGIMAQQRHRSRFLYGCAAVPLHAEIGSSNDEAGDRAVEPNAKQLRAAAPAGSSPSGPSERDHPYLFCQRVRLCKRREKEKSGELKPKKLTDSGSILTFSHGLPPCFSQSAGPTARRA